MSERYFSANDDAPIAFPGWDAIWAGTFAFVAIWSVFGALGLAIFSVAGPNPVGMGIWAVVLTIIAMFVAGRLTGRLAPRHDAVMMGTVTFGLCVAAALLIGLLGALGLAIASSVAGPHVVASSDVVAGIAWVAFISLLLGWMAAVAGASLRRYRLAETPEHARHATA